MADIIGIGGGALGCDDGERGERGKRGKRGRRGRRGRDGRDGNGDGGLLFLSGSTSGSSPSESVDLDFTLEDGKAYAVVYTAVAVDVQSHASRSFEGGFNGRRDGGAATIADTAVGQSYGDAATADWSLEASTSGDRFVLTFTTGDTAVEARVTVQVEFTEVNL